MDELSFHTRLHAAGTILDVGAHDGLLAIPLARLQGARVVAFEPLPSAFARLRAAVGAAGVAMELRPEALGSEPGTLTLSVPVLDGVAAEQWASLAKSYESFGSVTTERHTVEVITVDSLGLADLQHMKVDAEGFEEEVLRGAAATLTRCRPVLSLEVEERHRAGSTRDVPALLASLGYETRFWLGGAMRPLAEFDAATMQVASPDPSVFGASDPYVFTFYAWPIERAAEVLARLS
ncbi:FkbM family methyltransferase [Falsiroseomonas oryziterrae]|uniref:FkbM family methyltransferase n=1 Tax=Falsiroseomonas oryziterrae TaxID=2911368 RepID=UPI001F017913|nr:FkbM family methyltransferase [Roseomonas sp. NPKOSM-4]